jgi:hypothetical protein
MSTHQQPSQPEVPAELWLLWIPDSRIYVLSMDDARDGPTYLAAFSQAEATRAAEHQGRMYDFHCVPVRVK